MFFRLLYTNQPIPPTTINETECRGNPKIRLIFPSSLGLKIFNIAAINLNSKASIKKIYNQKNLFFLEECNSKQFAET